MNTPPPPIQIYARVGGALYLVIILAGVFAEAFVRGSLVMAHNPGATATHILGSQGLWRVGLVSELLMLVCDVVVALVLYIILEPISRGLALLGAFFRLVQVAISGLNALNHLSALLLISGADYLKVFDIRQLQAAAMYSLKLQSTGYDIALIFFGVDCLVIGYLVFRAAYLPATLGVLMAIAGVCYLANSLCSLLDPPLASVLFEHGILLPPLIAETSLALWLLVMGVSRTKWTG